MQRLFIATHIPQAIATIVEHRQQTLRAYLGEAQHALCWTPKAQYHLTLAFLGTVDAATIPAIINAQEQHCREIPPQHLALGKCGFFARRGIPTVLWCNVQTSPELNDWCTQLRQIMQPLCPNMDGKEFHPHLTLARIRRGRSIDRGVLKSLFEQNALCGNASSWLCNDVSLVHSKHCCQGATHSLLHTSRLGEEARS